MSTDLSRRLRELAAQRGATLGALLARRGEEFGVYPLSYAQRRLWILTELHPGTAAYNVPYAFRMAGALDVPALERALAGLVRRHESLRTVFFATDGEPWQAVLPELNCPLRIDEHPEVVGDTERQALAAEYAAEEAGLPFDLSTGPLLRARLVRFDAEDAVLLLTLHHIVCDGWSMRVLFDDLERGYREARGEVPAATDPPGTRYVDFARWQREWLTDEVSGRLLEYWAEQLAGAPPVIELPADRPRPALPQMKGGIERFTWPAELAGRVTEFAQRERTTPFVVLLAAFTALLHRYTGQDDIVVGTPAANRTRVETEHVVGFFVNMLPLRGRITPDTTFRALTRQLRKTVVAGQAHQELPFEILVDRLRHDSNTAHHPLFQVVCALQEEEFEELRLPGLAVIRGPSHSETAKFDLSLSFSPGAHGLNGWLEYDTGLFDQDTAAAALGHLHRLLAAGLSAPDSPVATMPLLSSEEERQLLYGWNRTALAVPDDRLTYELIEERVDALPDVTAVSCGPARLTYRELDDAANRLAHRLIASGVGPESLVGILLDRSVELAVCALAIWKAGAAYLPLDPANPPDRLRFIVQDARLDLVLTCTDLVDRLRAGVPTLCLDTAAADLDGAHSDRPARTAGPDNLAYVIYTSGSTGRPKGVMIPHRGMRNLVNAVNGVLAPVDGDRILQFASFSFDASVFDLALCLTSGAELVFAPRERLQPGPDLVETMRTSAITMALLPPTAAALMDPADVPSLRTVVLGGEACPPELVASWSSGRALFNAYGPTEASVITTMARCLRPEYRISIGGPLPNTEVYILDEWMQPTPVGVPGELYIGGLGLARGYLHRPGLTAERFVPDPFSGRPGDRLYRTGDILRYRADAQLEFVRRADGQVKIRGLRIELGEIQVVLSQQPGVRTSFVGTREYGPGDVRLVAYVVPEPSARPDPATLRRGLREVLPEFMVPAHFVPVDAIPQTPNGKVDHAALARIDLAESEGPTAAPPRTELERGIADVWRDVLGVSQVGLHDNFFDLGGNSLLITKVRARLEQQLGTQLATLTLFRHPTVHDLAANLAAAGTAGADGTWCPVDRAQPDRSELRAQGRRALAERSRRLQSRTDGE